VTDVLELGHHLRLSDTASLGVEQLDMQPRAEGMRAEGVLQHSRFPVRFDLRFTGVDVDPMVLRQAVARISGAMSVVELGGTSGASACWLNRQGEFVVCRTEAMRGAVLHATVTVPRNAERELAAVEQAMNALCVEWRDPPPLQCHRIGVVREDRVAACVLFGDHLELGTVDPRDPMSWCALAGGPATAEQIAVRVASTEGPVGHASLMLSGSGARDAVTVLRETLVNIDRNLVWRDGGAIDSWELGERQSAAVFRAPMQSDAFDGVVQVSTRVKHGHALTAILACPAPSHDGILWAGSLRLFRHLCAAQFVDE
jgi:hypothetical protein